MVSTIKIGGRILDLSSPRVMSIINVTPDSFFVPSRRTFSTAVEAAASAIAEGADILDIGGCSTRPGAVFPSAEQEYLRVSGVIKEIRRQFGDFPLSIDTFRADVVRRIVEESGPVLVNDISAGQDPDMFRTVSDLSLPYVLCHMPRELDNMHAECCYDDIVSDMLDFFVEKIKELFSMGIYDVIVDPNFGFAKNETQNLKAVAGIGGLLSMGLPLMVGVSRKRFVCSSAGCTAENALPVTSACHMALLERGVRLLRVHDTAAALSIIKLFNGIKQS